MTSSPPGVDPVTWSIRAVDADSGIPVLEENSSAALRTASIGKVLLLIHVARLIEAGDLDPAELLSRTPADAVADSGLWQHLSLDHLSVTDACELVGAVSDNLATNVLLRRVGLAAVAETAERLELTVTALHDRVRDVRTDAHPATLSTGSAAELAGLFLRLHQGTLLNPSVSAWVLDRLANGADLSQVAAGWLLDPLAHGAPDLGLTVRHKTGTDSDVRADVGLLTGPTRTVAYAVLANWRGADPDGRIRSQVLERQRSIGEHLRLLVGAPLPA